MVAWKAWLAAASLVASATLSAGVCRAEPVTLNVWTIDREGGYIWTTAKEFEAAHPDVKIIVKRVQFTDIINDLARATATGGGPDVTYIDNPAISLFASRGLLLGLKPLIAGSKTVDAKKIFPGPLASVTYKDEIYGIPRGANTLALYYNADMFKAKGLDPDKPPRTWDELYDAAKKLNDPAANVYGIAFSAKANEEGTFQFLPWLQMTGGDYTDVDTPGGVKALKFWQRLIDEKLASPDVLIRTQFESTGTFNAGNAAMVISGPWELPRMSTDAKFDYRVTILPTETAGGPHASALGEGDNVILASSKHPKEAFAFIEYLYEQMPRVWNEFGFLPAYPVDLREPKWPKHYAVFVESMKYARVRGPHPEWQKISKAIQTAIQSTLTHQVEAEAALATAAATIKEVLK
ncbi:MAG: ABC transporter substrate-binding protein [Hyphomicrobiales bacterium]